MRPGIRTLFALVIILAVTGCAAGPQRSSRADTPQSGAADRSPKILTVALQQEPVGFFGFGELGASSRTVSGGAANPSKILHEALVHKNEAGQFEPRLAAEGISVEKGTWQANPDGTMETIWKLRPNAVWHDGAPFTSADMLFSFRLRKDADIAVATIAGGRWDLIESASAPDPTTFILHWSSVYVRANEAIDTEPYPLHLLGDLYERDKDAFVKSPYFSNEFVGLGPYRLDRWEQGAYLELVKFEPYFLGPPHLDRIVIRFITDPNTTVATILSGAIDAVLPTGVSLETAAEVKRRWEGTGNQVQTFITGRLVNLEPQFRPEHAQPTSMLMASMRQALYHAVDRETLLQVATYGLAPPADSYIEPTHAQRRSLETAIPQYPYDPARAQALLAQAGWQRGADGVSISSASGERFDIQLWGRGAPDEPVLNITADNWKAVGAQPSLVIIPPARLSDREYEATHAGPLLIAASGENYWDTRLHPRYIGNSANRWVGANRSGYANPIVESLIDRIAVTLDEREAVGLHTELVRVAMGDVALFPLYWEVVPVLSLRGVSGIGQVGNQAGSTARSWDKEL
jgi:peptide/nickel transport system substrate-binding protein